MKPFDLEKALAGEPVVTRCGVPVTDLAYLKSRKSVFNLAAVTNGGVYFYTKDGRYPTGVDPHPDDLCMAPKVRTVYVNLFTTPGVNFKQSTMSASFDTIEQAKEHAERVDGKGYAKLVKIAHPVEVED